METWIIKFEIENNQEEYAKCLQVIEAIENRRQEDIAGSDFLRKVTYKSVDFMNSFADVVKMEFAVCEDSLPKIGQEDRCRYFFEVDCTETDDIINLIYYCLVNDRIDGKGILGVKCQGKLQFNIQDLLSDMLIFGEMKEYYVCVAGKYYRVDREKIKIRRNRRFSPIFKIDQSGKREKAVDYWRRPVQAFLKDVYSQVRMGDSDSNFTVNYFLPHIAPKRLKKEYPKDVWNSNAKCREIRLLNNFMECFCNSEENLGLDAVRKRYEYWKSKKLFERIKYMPLLAMYIFCLMDYHQKNKKESQDSWESIDQEIFDARDMAEGFLQILENIYHSEYQRGYFCFRIHNNTLERSGGYLKKEYPAYIEEQGRNAEASMNYLEMKVVDFSHKTIPMQFYKSFSKRMEEAEETEKEEYKKICREAAEIKVASFYDETTEFWKQYNTLSENVIHHYGLQIFQSLIACYQGYFQVRSQGTAEFIQERDFYSTHPGDLKDFLMISGTQYDALIPFGTQNMTQNISMDVNLRYDNHLIEEYEICKNRIKFNTEAIKNVLSAEENKRSFQERKELVVRRLAEKFERAIIEEQNKKPEKKYILHISAKDIMITTVELFCKTLMLYIARNGQRQNCYIMITECTQSHFVELARMMALFYNKQGQNPLMGRTQIFMSGDDESEEFLITGTNLEEAVAGTEKLAFARSVHPNCLKSLRKSLKNHMLKGLASPNDVINIVPFDMINYPEAEKTLMESRMQKVLEQDVQSGLFGCKLENLHVRIGSKIHIRTFYEAELLFHNNYYTLRFAYWLYNELNSDSRLKKDEPFVLVGYENYSEMLINELCNMFYNGSGIKVDYIIYEERSAGKFRGKRNLSQYKDAQFVIIVPINSTSTTHIKITGFLEKTIRSSLNVELNYHIDHKKVLNYGIVLIGTKEQNMYWDRDRNDKKVIVSKIDGKKLKYYVEVQAKWETPLKCEVCFPEKDYTKELPLIETNKESVVPMHAISMRRPHISYEQRMEYRKRWANRDELDRLKELSQILIYRHIERNGNHFNYYFSTEKLWENEQIKKNIEEWLKGKRTQTFRKEEYKVYDIIVAPLHYSNTVFVEEVNNWLFYNAALVLHFDVDKEFRTNVRTKYSSIQQLYDNLCMDNEKSVINFHYVDDTIISGRTYQRMKSLMNSLIRKNDNSMVEINIFRSIVLLLNRMSASSIKDYIEEPQYFMAYFNLNISSMRVNSDACILCKKYGEWNKLSEQAALNDVYIYWREKSRRIKCVSIEEFETFNKPDRVRYPERAAQYMIASHRAKRLLDEICDCVEIDEIIEEIVVELFPESIFPMPDELIAVLKILGRPFLTFRREEKEAVFKLMLIMTDVLLNEKEAEGEGKLQRILRDIQNDRKTHIIMVTTLINRLAELESNYIIRKNSMERILAFAQEYIEDQDQYNEFIANYSNRIKQLIGQSNDLAKGLYLEYLLLYGQEYNNIDNRNDRGMASLADSDQNTGFRRRVYLENTKLVNYGIEYLADYFWNSDTYTEENMKEALNSNYYFDNFIQYLAFHKVVEINEREKVKRFVSDIELKKLAGMVHFELLYQRTFGRKKISGLEEAKSEEVEDHLQDKFGEMLKYLEEASGALDGEIIVPYEKEREVTGGIPKYIALGLKRGGDIGYLTNKDENLLEFMREERQFEGDTYAICHKKGENTWVLFKFYDKIEPKNGGTADIYMLFVFREKDEGELLHTIKNILIFRNKIWRILNLSNDVLLQNLTDNLFYKQQMLKSRATGHMDFSKYLDQLEDICSLVNNERFINKSEEEKKLVNKYFNLLVNSMIGFMNAQVLGGRVADYARKNNAQEFFKVWISMEKAVNAAEKVWDLQMVLRNDEQMKKCIIRKIGNGNTPLFQVWQVLFLAVFQNIYKHKEKEVCKVFIYAEENGIYVKNMVSEDEIEEVEKSIRPEAYRASGGISLAVIYDICRAYYPGIKYSEMFFLQHGNCNKNGSKRYEFVVKLPIIG